MPTFRGASPDGYNSLTLNGHYWPPGRTILTNDSRNQVHVHISNYQDRYYGGAGMIRMYAFDLARNVIDVETFSPWFLARDPAKRTLLERETIELTGPVDRFSLDIDFAQRFNGFDPVKQPAPRPAAAVMPHGTMAYWRFDAAGLASPGSDGTPVKDDTVVKDLTGGGNDLKAQLLHSSGAEALTWSREHHPGQPAHASLRFDGGQSPNRGAVLRTGPKAPINSMKFESGYTIETFIKFPDHFVGNHAWMGILRWEGRASDAGKSSGWSPDEPTCSLNVSGEGFLQYVVYPSDRDADPTSWSHALPIGRWMHLAVVNDSRHTTIYVDGSKIARNPTQPSHGIATVGKPFAIGRRRPACVARATERPVLGALRELSESQKRIPRPLPGFTGRRRRGGRGSAGGNPGARRWLDLPHTGQGHISIEEGRVVARVEAVLLQDVER